MQPLFARSTLKALPATLNTLRSTLFDQSLGGGGVLSHKGLMGTCGQPGYVFRDFCLKQGIEIIIFCLNQGTALSIFFLKQDVFSWTINSRIFTSAC